MTYNETLEYLYSQLPMFGIQGAGAYKPGLDTARLLSASFGNPHERLRCVHIAGTNGKGSTSSMIASALQMAGYRVGLYTSPHIHDFRERIRINGEMIPQDNVVDFVGRYISNDMGCNPSFFELTTIMAFEYFAAENVDYAVIETGLGGRLDTTNIITPELCVITNVSIDHVEQLGVTLPQIASEKAGIIKPGVPVLIGEKDTETALVFSETGERVGAPLTFAEDTPLKFIGNEDGGIAFDLDDNVLCSCELTGEFQKKNINTAVHALRLLGVNDAAIISGMANVCKNTGLKGRWTVLREASPRVIYDTGHNEGAWRYLVPALARLAESAPLRIVLGFVSDKDIESVLRMLSEHVGDRAIYYFVSPATRRARSADSLREAALRHGIHGNAYASVAEGVTAAIADSRGEGVVFIGGSNYVAAEVHTNYE